ncbi:hypothetical protein CFP56_029148 [Quercus suber]|uniref:Uncharacterized protein n=1 Tax=Quercus suber TaxID=58331 RepID=A0AAW0MBR7_QUESU
MYVFSGNYSMSALHQYLTPLNSSHRLQHSLTTLRSILEQTVNVLKHQWAYSCEKAKNWSSLRECNEQFADMDS